MCISSLSLSISIISFSILFSTVDKKSFKGGASLLKSDLVKRKREKSTLEAIDAPKTKKNKPQEMPSNRPVPRLNASSISGITIKKTGFDPRFEGDATAEDQQLFRSAYRFIDDIKSGEIEVRRRIKLG